MTAAFDSYERALMQNNLDALHELFWASPLVIRFGPGQTLFGIEVIAAFRLARIGGSPPRTLHNTVITTFGLDFATANTEFQRQGTPIAGRQSWARLEPGWRVVAAHVSLLGTGS